jgi:hypothetical protein
MNKELKLCLTKKFVNFAVRILDKLIPKAEATHPQTQMIEHMFKKLSRAYRTEVYAGRFDGVPCQTLNNLKDRNFQRFLNLSENLLVYLGENDRYYRQWLGYALLLAEDEVKAELERLSMEDFLRLTKAQWEFDMRGAFPKEYFMIHKQEFLNILLANFLTNLA